MATGPRLLLTPAPFGAPAGAAFPVFSVAGVDQVGAGGTNFATAWSTNLGVMIPNQGNGAIWLYYLCGATLAGTYQVLVGEVVAGGQVLAATIETGSIAATSSGFIGPWSPATFNQSNPTGVTYAGAINTTALTSAAQGCVVVDFTTTTSLCVRAYQNITQSP